VVIDPTGTAGPPDLPWPTEAISGRVEHLRGRGWWGYGEGGSLREHRCSRGDPPSQRMSGGDLLSHAASRAVPSALVGLASGFGMGPGVSPPLWPPKLYGDVAGIPPVQGPPALASRGGGRGGGLNGGPDRISGTTQWTQHTREGVDKSSAY
jgi:hypothetical protein